MRQSGAPLLHPPPPTPRPQVFDALNGTVPLGLVSNNWGGTPVQVR
jgi:hypothetical protein